jgi:SOS-response transcriptional repressor LexA
MAANNGFFRKVGSLTNHQLYKLAVKYLIEENSGLKHNKHRLDSVYDECSLRNQKIFDDAVKDSIITISTLEDDMDGMKVVRIQRIDYMDEIELLQLLQTTGAAAKHPVVEDSSVVSTSLNEILGIRKENLFACTVSGVSMKEAGIIEGDVLIVDTELKPVNEDIVVAAVNGNLFVKRIIFENGNIWLNSENEDFKPVLITSDMIFNVFGVVMHKLTPIKKSVRRQ